MSQLQKAVVRSLPGEPNMVITLIVAGKQRNMDRPKDELLEKPLGRLQKSAAPQPAKQQKRPKGGGSSGGGNGAAATSKQAAAAPPPAAAHAAAALFIGLHAGPSAEHPVLDAAAVTNAEAWQHGRLLRIGSAEYQVELNPPLLDKVELHGVPFVGIPLMPTAQLHFADEDACQWQWFRQRPGGAPEPLAGATGRRYTPQPEDAGCRLRVRCTPARWAAGEPAAASPAAAPGAELLLGAPAEAECGPVAVPPVPAGVAPRHALTQQPTTSPELRVVTYNILADQYAGTDTAKTVIFAHCPLEHLDPDYRRPLVLAELLGFNADVMCLQEVDEKMFNAYLVPQLAAEGYHGVYTNKAGKPGLRVREGSATFFRTSRYCLVAQRGLVLKDFFPTQPGETAKYGDVFADMLRSSPPLQQALQRIATVAQLSLLAPEQPGDRPLCVLNTHLFFHYMAPHIRTMHVWAMLQEAQAFIEEAVAQQQLGGQRPTLLFCGDLNSDLNDGIPGAIELLSKGRLPADFWDWHYGAAFKWEKGEEGATEDAAGATASTDEFGEVLKQVHSAVEHAHTPRSGGGGAGGGGAGGSSNHQQQQFVAGVDLQIPFSLRSADGLRTPFTNHVKGYQGLLDYIWFERGAVEVVREVPLPTLEQLGGYLPSARFPSDHLPVVFDLRFRAAAGAAGTGAAAGLGAAAGTGSGSGATAGSGGAGPGQAAGGSGGGSSSNDAGDGSDSAATAAAAAAAGNVLPAAMYNVGLAVEALQQARLLAVPTDTLYGLAACAKCSEAVAHIYSTKRRGDHKPLAICVADIADVALYADTQHLPAGLLEDLLPGPFTLLLTRRPDAPLAAQLNAGVPAIGIRIPDSAFMRAVCRQHRGALALTSANVSGGRSSIAVHEFQGLWAACGLVLDGGPLDAGRSGSTVIDLTLAGEFSIQRRGSGFARGMQLLQEKHGMRHVLLE